MLVVVTRPEADTQAWLLALRARGHEALALPLLGIRPALDTNPLRQAWQRLPEFHALMFVSGNAVRHFAQASPEPAERWQRTAPSTRAWATGPGTAAALQAFGLEAARIDAPQANSGQFDSEHLWQRVRATVAPGQRVLIVRGGEAPAAGETHPGVGRDWLAGQLRAQGVEVEFVVAYERAEPVWTPEQHAQAQRALREGAVWLLSSSEAVGHLRHLLPQANFAAARAHATHERIAQAARAAGFAVVTQSRPALPEVIAAIESAA